jgi:hypothetical protein
VHQLVREAWRRVERAELPPRPGAQPGLLLELPPRRHVGIFLGPVVPEVEAAGRDLEQGVVRGDAPLADECGTPVAVERDDRDRTRVPGEIADGAGAVGALDRVDPELDELAAVEDVRLDDALAQLLDLLAKIGPGGILRGRWLGLVPIVAQSTTRTVMRPP